MTELSDIVGQESAIEQIARALTAARVPHALLFAGPDGVGRRTAAVAMGKTLLCAAPMAAGRLPRQACGRCDDCRMVETLAHPDLHLVYKELAAYHDDPEVRNRVMQELGIPVIRSFLIAPAHQTAARGRGKVFIVLEAELMSDAAQNALLKTLEEPPPGTTIILIAESPDQLLATTQSRCRLVRFGPLPAEFVARKLAQAGVEEAEATFWARFSQGSVGSALSMAQQGLFAIKREVVERLGTLAAAGDAELGEDLAKLTESHAASLIKSAKSGSPVEMSKNLATRQASSLMLRIVASLLRDAMHLVCGETGPLVHADQPESVRAAARRLGRWRLPEAIEQVSTCEQLLWRNVSSKIVWDNVVITCASAAPLNLPF